jgi:hypothetical protein
MGAEAKLVFERFISGHVFGILPPFPKGFFDGNELSAYRTSPVSYRIHTSHFLYRVAAADASSFPSSLGKVARSAGRGVGRGLGVS